MNSIDTNDLKYYTNYMLIKADATTILHSFDIVKNECIIMCQELTYKLYNTQNEILFYIKNKIIPETFPELFDGTKNYEKIKKFIYNEFNDENRFNEYFNSFMNIQFFEENDGINLNPIDLENYNNLFFRCYLKGGSAFYFVLNLYIHSLKNISNNNFIGITNENIETYLGKKSDYDFDILINENLEKKHYDELAKIITIQIIYYLKELIYDHPKLFNNDAFIKNFMNKLNNNNPPLYPLNPSGKNEMKKIIIKSSTINDDLIEINNIITNNVSNNKIGLIYFTKLKFKNAFEEEGKEDVNFILIRLLTEFKQKYMNGNKISNINAEIFDFSIPLFESYEKKIKWKNTKNNIKIDGVYCYNLNSIINDLNTIIKETIKNNVGLNKLEKRKNRLIFFNNLICIIPRLLIKDSDEIFYKTGLKLEDYNEKCEEILSVICKNYINELNSTELENLKKSLEGIYLNFPETINPKKLNIFVILKQYFKNKLIDVMNNPVNETNYMTNIIFKNCMFDDIMHDDYPSFGNFLSQYFNIIHLDGSNILINEKIYNDYCINIIDSLEKLSQIKYQNTEQIEIFLCKLFVNYSVFINSFSNFFLSYDSIILFIELLYKINSIYENNTDDIIYFSYPSVENYIFYSRNILKNILIENENFSNSLMDNCTKDIIICTLFINNIIKNIDYKLCLRGSYAYNVIQLLYNNSNTINYNDIDSYLILNDDTSYDDFIIISKQIYNHYLNLLSAFLENNLFMYNQNISFKIEMRLTDIGILIQLLATMYVPLNSESSINLLFNNSIIGTDLIGNEKIIY